MADPDDKPRCPCCDREVTAAERVRLLTLMNRALATMANGDVWCRGCGDAVRPLDRQRWARPMCSGCSPGRVITELDLKSVHVEPDGRLSLGGTVKRSEPLPPGWSSIETRTVRQHAPDALDGIPRNALGPVDLRAAGLSDRPEDWVESVPAPIDEVLITGTVDLSPPENLTVLLPPVDAPALDRWLAAQEAQDAQDLAPPKVGGVLDHDHLERPIKYVYRTFGTLLTPHGPVIPDLADEVTERLRGSGAATAYVAEE